MGQYQTGGSFHKATSLPTEDSQIIFKSLYGQGNMWASEYYAWRKETMLMYCSLSKIADKRYPTQHIRS